MSRTRAGATALAFAALLAVTGCSAGGATGSTATSVDAAPSDTESVGTDAPTPTGTEAIFDIAATLHPGEATGGTVPTKVDVMLTNIGTAPSALTGAPTLSDAAGQEYPVAPGAPGLDFGTVAVGASSARSYTVDLPVGAVITTILVESDSGVGVDGPATAAP